MGNRPSSVVIAYFILAFSLSLGNLSFKEYHFKVTSSSAFADEEISNDARQVLARLYNSSVVLSPQDVIKISVLEKYKFYDVGEILWDRFELELRNINNDRRESKVDTSDIFEAIFKIAGRLTTQEHRAQLERCLIVLHEQMNYLEALAIQGTEDQLREYLSLKDYFDTVEENLKTLVEKAPRSNLPHLQNPIEIPRKSKPTMLPDGTPSMGITQDEEIKIITREEIQSIKDEMSKKVIGQPVALQALINILYETYTYGYGREKPKRLFFSGTPGSGKDTLVREFANAIHKSPTAYQEHVFEAPIAKSNADLWALQGSTTGHVGSETITPFIKWLVKHSGGKYQLLEPGPNEKFQPHIIENKNWSPGQVLSGYFAPEESVLYVNEVDKWSKNNINQFLLRAMEKGYFVVNNPGAGLDRIYVPINIIFSSNDLIPDIAARDKSGKRYGPPLSIEQLNENVVRIEQDPSIFRNRLMSASSSKSDIVTSDSAGYSEEFINRLGDQELIPLRVLTHEDAKTILGLNMETLQSKMKNSLGAYAGLELEWSNGLVDFLFDFQRNDEEGARRLQARVDMVESTLMSMIEEEKIKPRDLPLKVAMDIEKNSDGTTNLVLRRTDNSGQVYAHTLIAATVAEKNKNPLSDAEFADLATLGRRLSKHVYGIDHILEKIGRTIALSKDAETRKRDGVQEHKKAEVFFLLGLSSTGKTETGKAIARELFKEGEAARVTIDFNNIKTVQDLRDAVLGTTSGDRFYPSKFMQEYDRLNGRVIFMFEEIANAPLEVLRALYDILDEAVVTSFADKKPRSMSKVIILATGNAGEEWYKGIPRDLSFDIQMTTMRDIYQKSIADQDYQRLLLEKYFSEAFINRVGIDRFMFFPPFSHQSIREVAIGNLQAAIQDLKPKNGQRGWSIGFRNQADYVKLIETVENEGFVLREQGRSIVNFVNMEIKNKIRWELRNGGVADNARVLIVPSQVNDEEVKFNLIVEGSAQDLSLKVKRRKVEPEPTKAVQDIALTSFHEAGHNFLMKVLMGDKFKATRVTRIPGVLMDPSGPIAYLGVAESTMTESMKYNREGVIETLARMLGGDIAETVVTKNGRRHSGISNDILRATDLAREAVGEWGLSDKWGRRVVKADQMNSLSDEEKKIFNSEVDVLLKDARALGEAIIREPGNFEVFKALGLEIFAKGDLKEKAIADFYQAQDSRINYPSDIYAVIQSSKVRIEKDIKSPENNGLFVKKNQAHHNVEFVEGIVLPSEYASIDTIIAEEKKAELSKVQLPKNIPIFTNFNVISSVNRTHTQVNGSQASVAFKPKPSGDLQGQTCARLFQ